MSAEHERRDYPLKASGRTSWGAAVPAWYLRLRLRWTLSAIAQLERQLAEEFAVLETAPMHRELEALVAERDLLAKRLAQRP